MHGGSRPSAPSLRLRRRAVDTTRLFAALFVSYTLEGIGYIVAGTFLVAAIQAELIGLAGQRRLAVRRSRRRPVGGAVGVARVRGGRTPSCSSSALSLQAVGIAMPALTRSAAAALVGAMLFGATFIGVSTLALAAGRLLQFPGAVALLTAGYSAGQIAGPFG